MFYPCRNWPGYLRYRTLSRFSLFIDYCTSVWVVYAQIFVLYCERHLGSRFNAALGTVKKKKEVRMVCVLTRFELGIPEYKYIPHT